MPEKQSPKFLDLASVPKTQSPEFRTVYVNNVMAGMGPWDIQMLFGRISENKIEQQVNVVISPQWAKALASVLARVVNDYEAQFGTISVPADILAARNMEFKPPPGA